ncbi:MAG: hypothetical protein R2715_00575 [Ilumatobacteraceae bacterium]
MGFLAILVFGRKLGEPKAGYFAASMVAASFITTVAVFFDLWSMDAEERAQHAAFVLWSWMPVGSSRSTSA